MEHPVKVTALGVLPMLTTLGLIGSTTAQESLHAQSVSTLANFARVAHGKLVSLISLQAIRFTLHISQKKLLLNFIPGMPIYYRVLLVGLTSLIHEPIIKKLPIGFWPKSTAPSGSVVYPTYR